MNEAKHLKVLVSAFGFSPVRGSEFAVGWDFTRAIAARNKVWLITRSTERAEIEEYLRQNPDVLKDVSIHYVAWPSWSWNFPGNQIPYYFCYRFWEWRAYRRGRTLNDTHQFDLIHRVNGTGFREPGYLWKIDKPFVWGPIHGMQYFPLRLSEGLPLRSRLFFAVKNLSAFWAMHFARRPKLAAARAKAIIASFGDAAKAVESLWGRQADVICESSVPLVLSTPLRRQPGEPIRIICCGGLEPRKALNILLQALSRIDVSHVDWQLSVVGDGPLSKAWKLLAIKCGIIDRCKFFGRMPRNEVFSMMAAAHCLVHTSLYEGTPTVVTEALAIGLPVICLDQFGCKDIVTEECGIRIPPTTLDQVIRGFADAITALAQDEERRYGMAIAAQSISWRLSWKGKSEMIERIYRKIVEEQRLAAPSTADPARISSPQPDIEVRQ